MQALHDCIGQLKLIFEASKRMNRTDYAKGVADAIKEVERCRDAMAAGLAEPTEAGLYWVEHNASMPVGYIHDFSVPIRVYWSESRKAWYMSDPETIYDEPLAGRRVWPVLDPRPESCRPAGS